MQFISRSAPGLLVRAWQGLLGIAMQTSQFLGLLFFSAVPAGLAVGINHLIAGEICRLRFKDRSESRRKKMHPRYTQYVIGLELAMTAFVIGIGVVKYYGDFSLTIQLGDLTVPYQHSIGLGFFLASFFCLLIWVCCALRLKIDLKPGNPQRVEKSERLIKLENLAGGAALAFILFILLAARSPGMSGGPTTEDQIDPLPLNQPPRTGLDSLSAPNNTYG